VVINTRYDDVVEDTHHVRVLTIHASKGAEAIDVCCFDRITGKIAREMDQSEETRQNEARTWYVGLSRASERLHLVYDAFPVTSIICRGISRRRRRHPLDGRRPKRWQIKVLTTDDNREECVDTTSTSEVMGSPVSVVEVTDEHVVLKLPDSAHEADRVIPQT
jgi:ATP-dependent exoDNAse (exonuclease V) beta subunit